MFCTRRLGKVRSGGLAWILVCCWSLGAPTEALTAENCEDVVNVAVADTTITSATLVPATATLPEYCQVEGVVTTPGNTVNFRLGLPTEWNGKFYHQGTGGFSGSIGPLDAGLARGYASTSTDTGHQGSALDGSWALNNLPKQIDYGHRGVHVVTVAAKSITEAYYGAAPRYAYFNGCSNGGRQALMEAQRYPDDFNGIIAGAPALDPAGTLVGFNDIQKTLLSSPEHFLPPVKLPLIENAVLATCDAKDGLLDGLIDDPRRCTFDPASLLCSGADAPDCLTATQLETVTKIYGGPRTSAGEQVYPGFPVGVETGWTPWMLEFNGGPSLQFIFQDQFFKYLVYGDPNFDWRTFNLDTDLADLDFQRSLGEASNPDLSAFKALGGKLLMYNGWSDPALTAVRVIHYYEDVVEATGDKRRADAFVRLFLAPGMLHCGGGSGPNQFDTLTALENWVERRRAPSRIIATHVSNGVVDRTRPLCPYPQVARYTGEGSIEAAENFVCKKSNKLPKVNFTVDPRRGTTPLSVQFTNTAQDPDGQMVEFLWDFGDGTTSTAENPSHTYTSSGKFTVTLWVTDDQGGTGRKTAKEGILVVP
jgi:hypothetical protein